MKYLKIAFLITFSVLSLSAFSQVHFAEIYSNEGLWKLDHFVAYPGKLQELVESKTFEYQFQALAYRKKILKGSSQKSKFLFATTEEGATPIWEVKNQWDLSWEKKYSLWVEENLTKDFFVKYNIETDCADVAYALRWIFSRIHHLPASATLAGSGITFTEAQGKTEWAQLPTNSEWHQDKKFLAALNWLLDHVFTGTLRLDGYPIQINQETIAPGLINLLGGHTEIFVKINTDGKSAPISMLSSTLPKKVRELSSRAFLDFQPIDQNHGGLLRFRWPGFSKEAMPLYSLEQYKNDLCSDESRFAFCILKKLHIDFNPDNIMKDALDSIISSVKQRITIVNDGYDFCLKANCEPGSDNWENWSTPSRDKRLYQAFNDFYTLAIDLKYEFALDLMNNQKIFLVNRFVSLREISTHLGVDFMSIDPRDPPAMRWALDQNSIYTYFNRNFLEADALREELIIKAEGCRKDALLCQKDKSRILELTTLEIDRKLQSQVGTWIDYCRNNSCPQDTKRFDKVWFQSPLPWESVEERRGETRTNEKILYARKVVETPFEFLILDNERIYNLKNDQEIILEPEAQIFYEAHSKVIWQVSKKGLKAYDGKLKVIKEIPYTLSFYKITPVKLGNGFLALMLEHDSASKALVIDSNNLELKETIPFHFFNYSENVISLMSAGLPTLVLYTEASGLKILKRPEVSTSPISKNQNEMFFIREDTTIYRVDYFGNLSPLFKMDSDNGYINQVTPNYFLYTDYGVTPKSFVFNNEFETVMKMAGYPNVLINDDVVLAKGSSDSFINVFQKNQYTKIPTARDSYLATIGKDWFSIAREGLYSILDFSGKIIESSPIRLVDRCSGSSHCFTKNPNILNEVYNFGDDNNHLIVSKVGAKEDFHILIPNAFTYSWRNSFETLYEGEGLFVGAHQKITIWKDLKAGN